jgi:magnesium transporter
LLLADPSAFIEQIMETDIVTVDPKMKAEDVAGTIAKYDLLAVPVADEHGKLLGIVTVDDAIDTVMPEDFVKKLPQFTVKHRALAKDRGA